MAKTSSSTNKPAKTKPIKSAAKRPRNAAAAEASRIAEVASQLDILQPLIQSLQSVRVKLAAVDRTGLSDTQKSELFEQIDAIDLALLKLRNAQLDALDVAFKAEVPRFKSATEKLAADLAKLNKVAEVINAVAGVLGVIESIAKLLK